MLFTRRVKVSLVGPQLCVRALVWLSVLRSLSMQLLLATGVQRMLLLAVVVAVVSLLLTLLLLIQDQVLLLITTRTMVVTHPQDLTTMQRYHLMLKHKVQQQDKLVA